MEERLNQMNAVLQAMQQTLQCNICLDLLNSPLTTKCGHSFCAECIQQVVKGPRGSAQCPLCLTHITRRSLGQNNKISGLVVAVRKIIDSIKKDCCFEVTPSKYRPRPHPITTAEDDNSENEENDEPRRGTRKRGITNHYNPEVHVPKPRARSAKQRILTSHGCQELSLHTDGKSQTLGTEARINNCSEHIFVDAISKEHSYSSPTKQEPLERPSLIPSLTRGKGTRGTGGGMLLRGRGRPAGNGTRGSSALNVGKSGKDNGKPVAAYCGKKTVSSKTGADILSVSQQAENTEFLPEEAINKTDESSGNLSEKLGREKPADKVAKWLHNSSEVGFRIGASHSTDTTSTTDSESSHIFNPSKRIALDNHQCPTQALAADSTVCSTSIEKVHPDKASLSSSKKKEGSIASFTGSKKFFKSKNNKMSSESECQDPQEDAETQIFDPVDHINSTPSDPYNFIPSQKTPKDNKTTQRRGRTVKTRGREALTTNRGRVRGRGRGRGIPVKEGECERTNDSVTNTNLDFSLSIQTQSTPINKGTKFNQNVNLSVIKPPGITTGITQGKQLESVILYAHDDESDIPDSCPVTTKDEFDVLVSEVNEKMTSDSDRVSCLSVNQKAEEDKETALIFVTPAQAEEEPTKTHESKLKSKKGLKKRSNGESDCEREAKRKPKTKKENISDNDSTSSSSSASQNVRNKRSKAEKAREEVEALCSMFEDIEEHNLSIMSMKEEEKKKQMKEKVKDNLMRENISIMDQTFENTQHNKTVSPTITKDDNTMPPPKAPTGNKKVRFNADTSVKHSGLCTLDEVTASSASTKSSAKISDNNTNVFKGSHNVRYASKMKSKFIDTNKSVAVSVNVKCAKSPGWSHVEGARKDLKVRQTSLNITGGEHCNINDSRTEGGTCGYSLNTLTSSDETDVTIDEETQEFDIEHLPSSQTKKDRVNKLKEIVSQLHQEEEKQRETKKQKVRLKRTNMSQPTLFKESNENTKDAEISHVLKSTGNIGHTLTDKPQHSRSQLLLPSDTESLHIDYKASSHLSDKVDFTKSSQKSLTQSASSRNKMIGQESVPHREKDNIKEFNGNEKKPRSLSKLNRKTFSLTVNTQDLNVLHSACESVEESPNVRLKIGSSPTEDSKKIRGDSDNCREAVRETSILLASSSTAVSKPQPPHYTVSPSLTLDSSSKTPMLPTSNTCEGNTSIKTACISSQLSSEKNFTTHSQDGLRPQVVPFKSLGSLCSERCSKAADDASLVASFGHVGRDLCLHAVPCEVYQVLLKYMALMATQVEEHRTCCGNTQVSKREQLTEPTESCAAAKKSTCGEKLKGNLGIQTCQAETEKLVEPDISEENKVKTVIQPPEGPNIVHSGEVEQESISEKKKLEIISISPEEPSHVHDREMVQKGYSSHEKENVNKSPEESNVHGSEVVPGSYNTEDMEVALPLPSNIGIHTHVTSAVCEQATGTSHQSAKRSQESSDNEKSTETHDMKNKSDVLNIDQSVTSKPYSQTSEILIEKCSVKSLIGPIESSSMSQMQDTQSSQLSTSLLALADVPENKTFLAYKNECPSENAVNVEGSSLEKNDRRVQSQKNKEKGVSLRTVVTDEELVEVEKENLESTNNFQPSINRPRRKPLQSGQPVLENIMSQVNKDGKKPPIEKEELSWMQSQISQDSQKMIPSQNRPTNSKPLFSTDSSGEPKSPKGNLLITECSAVDRKGSETSDDDSPLKVSLDSSKRSFKRIRRPASSSSSSEDSDTEAMINPPKRKPKVISSSSSNPSSHVLEQTQKAKFKSLKQHTLDSEEMRDLERLDQNVWEFFGHPDEDLLDKRDDDQNSHVSIDDIPSQNVKNMMEFDDPPPMTLSLPSDDEIPGTAEVLKNVNADMAIIKKMRDEKAKDPEVITVTSSHELHSESIPTLSSSTKQLFTKVDKSLTKAESLLDHNTSFFENIHTPEEEKTSIGELGIASSCMKPTKKLLSDKEDQSADEKALEVIGASDQETEDEVDNASHSTAYSSQSEAISTQKQKQVKDEVAMLKARVRELEAAMKKKDATEVGKAQPEVDILPPTCPSVDSGDESEELFSSLPDLIETKEPKLLPSKDQTVTKESAPRCIRSIITGPPQLVCTGLNSSEMGKVQDLVNKWATPGSSVKRSWDKGITHVVVKTEPDRLAQRTLKYLFGVATGCWVITLKWVLDSLSTRKLLPEEDYEVLDCTGVSGPKRGRTSSVPLFSNCEFYIKPPFVDVTVEQLKELMELCGAQIVDSPVKFSQNKQSMKLVVVQTDSDHNAEEYKKVSVAHDWIIECIGMYAHICIAPYIVGSPNQSHLTASCLPQSLLEETQEL
ncbi:uncharacterized protein [Panulirus ornatus]|uniref:uncharacterized protein n=1 Tax=Panulirus ornatus TaxID=150431 RepID=UPI003A86E682